MKFNTSETAIAERQNLRVLLAAWAPFVAGAEVAVERLAVGLKEAGDDVMLIVGTDGEALARFRDAGLRCLYVEQRFTDKLRWLRYRRCRAQFQQAIRNFRPALVHSNDLPTSQMATDAARRECVPTICHHRWIFDGKAIDWFNKNAADRHLYVSQALKDELCRDSASLAAAPGQVVYDGLPLPNRPTEDDRMAAKAKLGYSPERTLILFAGQIIERKGVADVLHAWKRLSTLHASADLAIVGEDLEKAGEYRRRMEGLAGELRIPVRFVGFQKNVPEWLTAADLVLVPSHAEPLGNATLEAMAYARPVIGSEVGGIPEMVLDGVTGSLVKPRSPDALARAIETLLVDERLRARLGFSARQRCESMFSVEAHVASIVAQYHLALARSKGSSR